MSGIGQNSSLTHHLEQTQRLSQQQRRSLELLHLPVTALEERIAHEFLTNPVLEERPPEEILPEKNGCDDGENPDNDESNWEARSAEAEEWSEELPLPSERNDGGNENSFLDYSPAPGPTLRELLLTELGASDLPEEKTLPMLEIISALDDNGYLRSNLADLAMICDATLPEMEEALAAVQKLAPPGVGARDLRECFTLQLNAAGQWDDAMRRLLGECWEELEENQISRIAEKMGISREKVEELLARLRRLERAPGRKYSTSAGTLIRPDIEVQKKEDGTFAVIPLRERFRRVILSPLYEKMAAGKELTPEERSYLTEKIRNARELISALERRDSTLTRLGEFLLEKQPGFWESGKEESLKPLTMKAAGEALGVAESTISRAAEEKFVRTPYGVRPFRFFFPKGYSGESGEISQQAVMEKIRRLIEEENPAAPLSDDKIAEILQRTSGIPVARRTVAKYRDLMGFASSSGRKKKRTDSRDTNLLSMELDPEKK